MNFKPFIEISTSEIKDQTWGISKQFLKVHELVYDEESTPIISRIDYRENKSEITIYFQVKDQGFFFCITMNSKREIIGIYTESSNSVYLRAQSKEIKKEDLEKLCNLMVTGGHNIGDKRGYKKSNVFWKESVIFIEPNQEPDSFESKLEKLLNYLETDKSGVKELVSKGDAYIQVLMDFHNGNTMLGGPYLNLRSLKKLSELGLEVNFDLYASGNFYRDTE